MDVPLVDLKAEYKEISKEVDLALKKVLSGGNFILGKEVKLFEKEFAKYCGAKYAVGVNSGTDAIILGLLGLGVGKGDEVIVPAFTYVATAFAVSSTGAKPVFVDIDESSYNIDVNKIEGVINERTKAIIPVHLYGQSADMQKILEIGQKHKLKIVEDACQAHGAEHIFRGDGGEELIKKAGNIGDVGCFSFYPTKNLGCYGDGGMVVTDNEELYKNLLMLRNYGEKRKYEHIIKGYNSRLDEIQAIILGVKLKRLDKWNELRRKNAKIYSELLKDVKEVVLLKELNYAKHVYCVYPVRIKNRDKVYNSLRNNGIGAIIHYPIPLHLQKAYQELGYKKGDFPIAEKISNEIISLPMYPQLKKEQISIVVRKLINAINEC